LNPTTALRQVFPSLFFCMCACLLFLFASRLLALSCNHHC
jgi:hypothetical protein